MLMDIQSSVSCKLSRRGHRGKGEGRREEGRGGSYLDLSISQFVLVCVARKTIDEYKIILRDLINLRRDKEG